MESIIEECKTDLMKTDPRYYKAGKLPQLLELGPIGYLSIKGIGAPEGERFLGSMGAIYPVAHALKAYYKSQGRDFVLPKLEGQWWGEGTAFEDTPREDWHWSLLIRMPDFVAWEAVERAVASVIAKKKVKWANEVHFETITEGSCVQVLHTGSYEEEGATIARLMAFNHREGLRVSGHHHEIYITDPKRTPVERLRTLLRYPVSPVS